MAQRKPKTDKKPAIFTTLLPGEMITEIPPVPDEQCPACHGHQWWWRKATGNHGVGWGDWLCFRCHPPCDDTPPTLPDTIK
jgi:hypothetical protein